MALHAYLSIYVAIEPHSKMIQADRVVAAKVGRLKLPCDQFLPIVDPVFEK